MTDLLTWVPADLQRDEDIIVPVKKMWTEWHAMHAEPWLEEFTWIELADEKIEEIPGVDHAEGMEDLDPTELEECLQDIEAEGFYSAPRAELKSREIAREHIVRMLKKHNERMEWALRHDCAVMPEDVSEAEDGEVINAIEATKEFRRKIRAAGLEPPGGQVVPPPLRRSP